VDGIAELLAPADSERGTLGRRAAPSCRRPGPERLLYVASEDWYFLSHRLPMARAARDAGFEVHVATRVRHGGDAIRAEGFVLHDLPFERGRLSPLAALRTVRVLRRLHRTIRPTIAHHVSLQPAVLATLAALDRDVATINALTGLGFAFSSTSPTARALRPLIAALLRWLLNRRTTITLVQNPDDHAALRAFGVAERKIALIAGSGVDVDALTPSPEPAADPLVVGFLGRLLEDKGVHTLVAAHRILRERGLRVRLRIAGDRDPANPTSVAPERLASWREEPDIELLGHIDDVHRFWAASHLAVLPSRREGMPKSLLEAAACGRPLIASDVPGCREVVHDDVTGLLVPVDDPPSLAAAIARLAAAPELRARYAAAARAEAESRFATAHVAAAIVELYRDALELRA
jgi:glycosyltransferase involved in cell wall biosynthesis